jgi:hypothetical protein
MFWSTTNDNMKANLFLLAAIMIVSKACCKNASNDKQSFSKDIVVADSSLGKLIQDVLNIPSVVKLSIADRIRKEYGILNVSLASDAAEIGDSILYQVGFPIKGN